MLYRAVHDRVTRVIEVAVLVIPAHVSGAREESLQVGGARRVPSPLPDRERTARAKGSLVEPVTVTRAG
jgi:hypothetical protein